MDCWVLHTWKVDIKAIKKMLEYDPKNHDVEKIKLSSVHLSLRSSYVDSFVCKIVPYDSLASVYLYGVPM
jgi:hypothetical protein